MAFIKKSNRQEETAPQDANGPVRLSGGSYIAPQPNQSNPNAPVVNGESAGGNGGGQFGRFVSLGEYLGQNQQQAGGMAQRVGDSAQKAGANSAGEIRGLESSFAKGIARSDKSTNGANATQMTGNDLNTFNPGGYEAASKNAMQAGQQNAALSNASGVQTNLNNAYAAQGQSAGEGLWDAAQAQQAGGGRFAQLASRYGDLGGMLNAANERSVKAYADLQARNAAWDADQERKKREADAARAAEEAARLAEREKQLEVADRRTPQEEIAENKKETGTKPNKKYSRD